MRLDSAMLSRLREALIRRGDRFGGALSTAPSEGAPTPEAIAVAQRVMPFCEVLYLLMVADERPDARELDVLRGAVDALTGGKLGLAGIDAQIARFGHALRAEGRAARLESVTGRLAADRQDAEAAFTLAAVMVIADEQTDARETSVLEELRELLGIPERRADTLLGEATQRKDDRSAK